MNKIIILAFTFLSLITITGCATKQAENNQINLEFYNNIDDQKNSKECLSATGYAWCESKQSCLKPSEERCPGSNLEQPDFNKQFLTFNEPYKTVLFSTGQNKESKKEIEAAKIEWQKIENNFAQNKYRPEEYLNTENWTEKITNIGELLNESENLINENNLVDAHAKLEQIRKDLMDMRTENNITILTDLLLSFHNEMELLIEDEQKNNDNNKDDEANSINRAERLKNLNTKIEPIVVWEELSENTEFSKLAANISEILANLNQIEENDENEDIEAFAKELEKLKRAFIRLYLTFG